MSFRLKSLDFEEGAEMPTRLTADGGDELPTLSWDGVPDGTKELFLLMEDPDAPGNEPFVHWLVFGIPSDTLCLPESTAQDGEFETPEPLIEGKNSFGAVGYGGPKPPEGDPAHRYYFVLYALDKKLGLKRGETKERAMSAIRGHVLAEARTMGRYQRHSEKRRSA